MSRGMGFYPTLLQYAIRLACPECGAAPGARCVGLSNRERISPHEIRRSNLHRLIVDAIEIEGGV